MSDSAIILYNTDDGQTHVRLRAEDGTVWLSQAELAELFQSTKQNISLHIQNIFAEGELEVTATVKEYLTVQSEGERQVERQITLYRLEVILAIGYRVRSERGIQFRRWASQTLTDYLVKGFVLDDERLKDSAGEGDYFDELLDRIRSIRASEKRFYQKVRDLFASSADYNGTTETARLFFQTIQNKLLWAVTGQTAAELIVARASDKLANMGLTSWKGAQVRKQDIVIAKNYLKEGEIRELDLLVSGFLDLAEDRARRQLQTTMANWIKFTDDFLTLAERQLLQGAGQIGHEQMLQITKLLYDSFATARHEIERVIAEEDYEKDFTTELENAGKLISAKQSERRKRGN